MDQRVDPAVAIEHALHDRARRVEAGEVADQERHVRLRHGLPDMGDGQRPRSAFRPLRMTASAPAAAKAAAVARPMPEVEAVTSATCPATIPGVIRPAGPGFRPCARTSAPHR